MKKSTLHFHHIRILFLICTMTIALPHIHAQSIGTKLILNIKRANLQAFTTQIENSTGFSFIYSEEVKLKHLITIKVENKTLPEILDLVFANESVSYKIAGKHIILQVKKEKAVSRKFTISGYVTDEVSAETLIGANILESRHRQGTSTNPYGFYSITLPEGSTEINFSYLGYNSRKHILYLNKDTLLNIRMKSNNQLQEVVVLSDKVESGIIATQMSASEVPMVQIKNTPSLLGETDVFKTIQMMPGVQTGIEGSSGLYVRGGGPDQNLILLDGVPVYNVEHLFGFFSVFTPESVKKVTLFKGSFPARFGGRLSSVVDIRSNDGDMKTFHGVVSIGLLSTKVNLEGPIIKDRTSFNISVRRSYLDLLVQPFMPEDEKISYYFYDINAKVNHKFSDRSRLFVNFYNGKDHYHYNDTDDGDYSNLMYKDKSSLNWGNIIASGRWNYIFNNKLFSNTTIAYNNYQLDMSTTSWNKGNRNTGIYENIYNADYRSGIRDLSYQIDFDYNPVPTHHIKFGTEYLYHSFHPEVMTSKIFDKEEESIRQDTIYQSISNSNMYAHEASAYLEDNFDISPKFRMNLGIHLSMFNVQKKSYYSVQPRISARYQLMEHLAIKAAYTKMGQYVHLLSSSTISMPTDLWVPVTNKIKPMQAHQYSLGSYYTGIKGWEISVEGYYKDMKNVLEYKDGVSFFGSSSGWEKKVEMGHGRSIGIELMAQKSIGNTTGWISYALNKSDRKFSKGGINDGERFPYRNDRRHCANLTVNHKFNNHIDFGASWSFASGGTTTIPEEVTAVIRPSESNSYGAGQIGTEDYIEHRNNYRLPASHKLNVSLNINKKTKHGIRTWNFSIYNVYNAMNPAFVYRRNSSTEYYNTSSGEFYSISKPVIKKITILPCIPSITYTYKF
ncbi:TonB-dependent receptor [Bacteroides ihuae]|uniref:TonB-dependent receptor n=1 Tax=Bacteroides ihuae TaxID=1852362 RepID=UPI0008DA4725|nr:TonB-dependent receptor [Bacteroides ihuae]